ncbi:hypothetical protein CANCADRAFT_32045 [Tortispora caseinolytica NRRL Y-17796]|uniref:Arrestin C-terminal-like domain-containing protein n=1 Tax=Tortispora caseinolytica NRRL Y-17796 TaxID=767744 RepID=A0A1E4TI47_9ASCO|nr:hypothetical protein CANCADRAFT_32045 [Tortispora caseinolytica NRRL Y-17796]
MLLVRVFPEPNKELVQGYPGIKATCPRIQGSIEIRSSDGLPITVGEVNITLYRTDTVPNYSSTTGLRSFTKRDMTFMIGKPLTVFSGLLATAKSSNLLALSIPFVFPLPVELTLPQSLLIERKTYTLSTLYQLYVNVKPSPSGKEKKTLSIAHPVTIQTYDSMPIFGQFNTPLVRSTKDKNHLVTFECKLTRTAFGPGDAMPLSIDVIPNLAFPKSTKVKLAHVQITVSETITHTPLSEDSNVRRRDIGKQEFNPSCALTNSGYHKAISFSFPYSSYRNDHYEIHPKPKPGYPLLDINAFSTEAHLYKIEYSLHCKISYKTGIASSNTLSVELPITVSPHTYEYAQAILPIIQNEIFTLNKLPSLPPKTAAPTLYRTDNEHDLNRIGFSLYDGTKRRIAIV